MRIKKWLRDILPIFGEALEELLEEVIELFIKN